MHRQAVFIAFLLFAAPVCAQVAGKVKVHASWQHVSDDGRFVLVMVSPLPLKQDIEHAGFYAEEARAIRSRYSKSGLYPNDGSTKPLWTIPYHPGWHGAQLAEKGKYLVLFDDLWDVAPENVLYFYTNGKLVRMYRQDQFMHLFSAKQWGSAVLESGYFGVDFPSMPTSTIDRTKHTFTITTAQYETITFDIATGKIIHHWSPWMLYTGVPLVIVPFFTWLYACRPAKRKQKVLMSPSQFSLRHIFLLMASLSIVAGLIRSNFTPLTIVCSTAGVVGGLLGLWRGRTRNAWILGAILSIYGVCFGGVLAAIIFGSPFQSRFSDWAWAVAMLASGIAGGLSAGLIERRRFAGRAAA